MPSPSGHAQVGSGVASIDPSVDPIDPSIDPGDPSGGVASLPPPPHAPTNTTASKTKRIVTGFRATRVPIPARAVSNRCAFASAPTRTRCKHRWAVTGLAVAVFLAMKNIKSKKPQTTKSAPLSVDLLRQIVGGQAPAEEQRK